MVSQTDRSCDAFGIAKRSQIIAVTAPDTEAATEAEGRTPYKWSPNHPSSLSDADTATTEAAPEQSQQSRLAWMDEIDLDEDVPCVEPNNHGRPHGHQADYVTVFTCLNCPRIGRYTVCNLAWTAALVLGVECADCGAGYEMARDVYRIVEVLR